MRLRYYMWAQTTRHVYVAIMLPTGYKDKELHMDFRGQVLVVQSEDFASGGGKTPRVSTVARVSRANHANGG